MLSSAYRYYVLATLTGVYLFNLVDRGLMMLLLQPIKEDLQLSDTELGFLTGIAFGIFYAVLGVPIARWSDRSNRVTITAAAIGLWGLTVMSCVLVANYFQLVLARIAAAVGESGCKPPTYSLVGDYFPEPAERTRAMAVYISGGALSSLVSFVVGGWLAETFDWRIVFFIIGIPGLVLAALVKFTVVEPRACERPAPARASNQPPMKEVLGVLWRVRSCRHLTLALIVVYTMSLGLTPWYAAFLIRSHGMGTGELGVWMGLILSVGGVSGTLLGGYVGGRWFARNERSQVRLNAVTITTLVPFFVAFLLVPHKHQALVALIPFIVALNFFLGPTYALMQRLVPDDMRATMMSVVMLLANLIGFGIGPQVVGVLSDLLQPSVGVDSLRYAMLTMSFLALWAAYHFWQVGQTVRDDLVNVGDAAIARQRDGRHETIVSKVALPE